MDLSAVHHWLSKATQGLFQIFFMSRITFSISELATKRHSCDRFQQFITLVLRSVTKVMRDLGIMTDGKEVKRDTKH